VGNDEARGWIERIARVRLLTIFDPISIDLYLPVLRALGAGREVVASGRRGTHPAH
jgi:hypothetical protein